MANNVIIQIARGTSDQWAVSNRILKIGELGADMTLRRLKVGTGSDTWQNLKWINGDMDSSLEQVLRMLSGITGGSLLDPVDNVSDLSSTYPSPTKGDMVFVRNADSFYYWDGTKWAVLTASGTDTSAVNSLIDAKLNAFGTFGMGYTVDAFNDYSKPIKITFEDGVTATLQWAGGTQLTRIMASTGEVIDINYNLNGTVTGRTVTRP
ncbi:MAG: hypothetical protein IJ667_09205 [Synergistaceae bacterium]|nr:hypothetical protein [Synergistaceae bacterium]